MCHAPKEKWKKTNNIRNRTAKLRKNQNTWRKGNLQALENIESGWLVGFYGISILVGYLMPNQFLYQ